MIFSSCVTTMTAVSKRCAMSCRMRTTDIARRVLRELFEAYMAAPQEMPPEHARRADRARAVADYVAGMTDRYAGREHARLTGRDLFAELAAAQPAPGQTRLDL